MDDLSTTIYSAASEALIAGKFLKPLKKITKKQMISIIEKVKRIFAGEKAIIELQGEYVVIGDIHGHLLELVRVLNEFGLPPKSKYIFLGDLVDRGEWSIECVALIYSMKICYPEYVYILRGNHEFDDANLGFHEDQKKYFEDDEIYGNFVELFSFIPLVAVVNKEYVCLHGGIGPSVTDIETISKIELPFVGKSEIVDEIVWSDPIEDDILFTESTRGCGFFFGKQAVKEFLGKSKLKGMIRGHSSIEKGCEESLDGLVYTVHTASCMSQYDNNRSGALVLKPGCKPEMHIYSPLRSSDYHPQKPIEQPASPTPIRTFPTFRALKRFGKGKLKLNFG